MLKAAEYTFNIIVNIGGHAFMAPAGAQGVGISVQAISCLEHAILILILLSRVCLRYLSLLCRTCTLYIIYRVGQKTWPVLFEGP